MPAGYTALVDGCPAGFWRHGMMDARYPCTVDPNFVPLETTVFYAEGSGPIDRRPPYDSASTQRATTGTPPQSYYTAQPPIGAVAAPVASSGLDMTTLLLIGVAAFLLIKK